MVHSVWGGLLIDTHIVAPADNTHASMGGRSRTSASTKKGTRQTGAPYQSHSKKGGKSGQKTGRAKDPNRIKRAPSAYLLYSNHVRKTMPDTLKKNMEEYAETHGREVEKAKDAARVIGTMWHSLSSDERQPFVDEADTLKAEVKIKRDEVAKAKEKERGPKRSRTAYNYFSAEYRKTVKENNPEMGPKDILREVGAVWKTLTDADKAKYNTLAAEDKERYTKELSEHKEQLRRQSGSAGSGSATAENEDVEVEVEDEDEGESGEE